MALRNSTHSQEDSNFLCKWSSQFLLLLKTLNLESSFEATRELYGKFSKTKIVKKIGISRLYSMLSSFISLEGGVIYEITLY